MKKLYFSIALLLSVLSFSSCEDFLDATPQDSVSDSNFWQSENDLTKFITDIYASTFPIVYEGNIFFDEALSDNSYLVWDSWYTDVKLAANGTQDAYGTMPQNLWWMYYSSVRKCCQVFANADKIINISEDTKQRLLAETKFLLAWDYYRLVSFFGDVPLVTKVLSIEDSKALTRTPSAEIFSTILGWLDEASAVLQGVNQEKGRISWGACQLLKARIYQMQNNHSEALKVVEGLIGQYSLYTEGETPYINLFSGEAEDAPEIILSIVRAQSSGSISTGHYANQVFFLKGMSGGDAFRAITPTGSIVDAYPMADGRLIHEAGSTYNPADPYKDRDPRLLQSILCPTMQMKYLDAATGTVQEPLYDPEDANTIPDQQYSAKEPSPTGYMWKKYVDWSPYAMTNITDCTNDIILMRYAEVLLIKAEALAELEGTNKKADIIGIVNQLRDRAQCGRVHEENYNTQEDLIDLVRNERRVELANEGIRYFDLLRWRLAEKNAVADGVGLEGDVYGAYMRLDGVGATDRTVTVDGVARRYVETRFFNPEKHYLQPIPQKEIDLNSNLTQNPNW